MTPLSFQDARILVRESFRRQYSREPTRSEAQHLQAIAIIETACGAGWHQPPDWVPAFPGELFDPENMGAIQKGSWTDRTFWYTDTAPNPDGSSTPYRIEFRYYKSKQAGMDDLGRVAYVILQRDTLVLPPATKADTLGFSTGLYNTHYYQGFGKTPAERIEHHRFAILNAIAHQAVALNELMPDGSEPPWPKPILPVLRLGAHGDFVKLLQRKLGGLLVDGIFWRKTLAAVMAFQKLHGLKVDGIVGVFTWRALGVT